MKKALIKFNNARLALLCSKCKVIIKTGRDFTEEESKYARGEIIIAPIYCLECQYKAYIDKRNKQEEKNCYCGHTIDCDCGNPDIKLFEHNLLNNNIEEKDLL